jgi:hypothetical protein
MIESSEKIFLSRHDGKLSGAPRLLLVQETCTIHHIKLNTPAVEALLFWYITERQPKQ